MSKRKPVVKKLSSDYLQGKIRKETIAHHKEMSSYHWSSAAPDGTMMGRLHANWRMHRVASDFHRLAYEAFEDKREKADWYSDVACILTKIIEEGE